MSAAVVTGIGWVTAAGMGRGPQGFGMPASDVLPEPMRKDVFSVSDKNFRRLDAFSRLGLAAAAFALQDAGLHHPKDNPQRAPDQGPWPEKQDIGLIASTYTGCLGTDDAYYKSALEERGLSASPHLFAYTLPSTFIGEAAIRFGLAGSSFVVHERPLTQDGGGLEALRTAMELLEEDACPAMLAGYCEAPAPAGYSDIKLHPGAVFAVLEKKENRPYSPYLEIMLKGRKIMCGGSELNSISALIERTMDSQRV